MSNPTLKIKSINIITHDVLRIATDKPTALQFEPGQAASITINKQDRLNEKRPFTLTGLPTNDVLEFTIKTYPEHNGVTNKLLQLIPGDALVVHEVFGTIAYKGEGVFIAGCAGVTPLISILRNLNTTG